MFISKIYFLVDSISCKEFLIRDLLPIIISTFLTVLITLFVNNIEKKSRKAEYLSQVKLEFTKELQDSFSKVNKLSSDFINRMVTHQNSLQTQSNEIIGPPFYIEYSTDLVQIKAELSSYLFEIDMTLQRMDKIFPGSMSKFDTLLKGLDKMKYHMANVPNQLSEIKDLDLYQEIHKKFKKNMKILWDTYMDVDSFLVLINNFLTGDK